MSSDHIDVRYVADLARMDLTDQEAEKFQEQLEAMLGYIDKLHDVNVEGVEPTSHAAPVFDRLREDIAMEGLKQSGLLNNAPESALCQVRVPRVVDAS